MPVSKFRSVEEMGSVPWHPAGSPELFRTIRAVWALADRMNPRRFPPGVTKYRSNEEAQRARDAWEEASIRAGEDRRRGSPG